MPSYGTYDYTNYYGVDPWGDITLKERDWYDPVLRDFYMRESVYSRYARFKVEMAGPGTPRARKIYFNDLIPPRPNTSTISARQMEATRLYTDSYQREVETARYGNGMALHRESELFTYWQRAGGGNGPALLPIIQSMLGQLIVDHLDVLARNAFLATPNALYGDSGTGFTDIESTHIMTTEIVDAVTLGMRDRVKPFSPLPVSVTGDELICITTPGVLHDLKREVGTDGPTFVEAQKYANVIPLLTGEIGMWRGVRFVSNGMAKINNAGPVTVQTTIDAAVQPGDGAPNPATTKVDTVRRVGQPGATHYITVADETGFAAGDIVTIHMLRSSEGARGVANGVDYTDPMLQNVQIHSVESGKIILKEPYMMTQDNGKGLETDLGGGTYGYVTKARNIHSALFLDPTRDALIAGSAQPPTIYTPPPSDDYMSIYRITYDMWLKYALWDPDAYEIWFGAGANKQFGAIYY